MGRFQGTVSFLSRPSLSSSLIWLPTAQEPRVPRTREVAQEAVNAFQRPFFYVVRLMREIQCARERQDGCPECGWRPLVSDTLPQTNAVHPVRMGFLFWFFSRAKLNSHSCSWPSVSRKMATDNVPADPSPHFVAAAAETEEQFLNRTYQWVAEALDDEELRDEYDEAVENGVKMDWALDLHKRLLEGRTIFRTLRDTLVTEFRTCRTTSCEGWRWKFNLMMDVQGGICMLEVWLAAAGHAELCA